MKKYAVKISFKKIIYKESQPKSQILQFLLVKHDQVDNDESEDEQQIFQKRIPSQIDEMDLTEVPQFNAYILYDCDTRELRFPFTLKLKIKNSDRQITKIVPINDEHFKKKTLPWLSYNGFKQIRQIYQMKGSQLHYSILTEENKGISENYQILSAKQQSEQKLEIFKKEDERRLLKTCEFLNQSRLRSKSQPQNSVTTEASSPRISYQASQVQFPNKIKKISTIQEVSSVKDEEHQNPKKEVELIQKTKNEFVKLTWKLKAVLFLLGIGVMILLAKLMKNSQKGILRNKTKEMNKLIMKGKKND